MNRAAGIFKTAQNIVFAAKIHGHNFIFRWCFQMAGFVHLPASLTPVMGVVAGDINRKIHVFQTRPCGGLCL